MIKPRAEPMLKKLKFEPVIFTFNGTIPWVHIMLVNILLNVLITYRKLLKNHYRILPSKLGYTCTLDAMLAHILP
jgi:hypothetical protein